MKHRATPRQPIRAVAPRKAKAFTVPELKARHAYLVKYRWAHLKHLIRMTEAHLAAQQRPAASWRLLHPFSRGRAFSYDAAAALEALGPDVTPLDTAEQRQRDAHADAFRAHMATVALQYDWD